MDPITHSLSGAILSRVGFYQRFGRLATIILLIGAMIPDIDHFTLRLAGPLAYLKYHRGLTHSIAGGLVLAAIIAGIACSISQVRSRMGFSKAFGLSLLGIYTHIFLDLITSYGTQVFFPFTNKRYSLDLVFIIDFYFTAILLIPLLVMLFQKKRRKILAFASLAGISLYLGIAYTAKVKSIGVIIAENNKFEIKSTNISAIPLPLSPFRWSVFTEDNRRTYQAHVDNLRGTMKTDIFMKRPENDDLIKMVEHLEIVKTYLWFARFPVVTVKEEADGYLVEYFDLRFNALPPRRPFLLKLITDKNGGLRHAELMFHTIK